MGKPTITGTYNRMGDGDREPYANLRGDLGDIPAGQVAVDEMRWGLVGGVAEHRFLRFTYRDADNTPQILDFHGLATDRETGTARPIGFPDKDNISIWPVIPGENSDRDNNAAHLQRMGTVSPAEAQRMMAAIAVGGREINDREIEYRALQTDLYFYDPTTNSNAANRNLLELAGLDPDSVRGGWAPGFTGRLMPPTDGAHGRLSIERIRTTLAGFSDEEVSANLMPAMNSLLQSIPFGDVMELDNRGMDEMLQRNAVINTLSEGISGFVDGMAGLGAAPPTDTAPSPGVQRAPALSSGLRVRF